MGLGSTTAIGLIGIVAVAFAVAPSLAAFGLFASPPGWVVAGLGCLGAAVAGVKLIAMAWAFGARLSVPQSTAAGAPNLD